MQATFDFKVLTKALTDATKVIAPRAVLPILGAVKITADDGIVAIETTDLEIHYRRLVEAKIETPGQVAVPAKLLAKTIKELPKNSAHISLHEVDGSLVVDTGHARLSLETFSVDDFPQVEEIIGEHHILTNVDSLRELLNASTIPASRDEARPVLTGVQFSLDDGLTLASTDSYRLGVIKHGVGTTGIVRRIVPARALALLVKLTGKRDECELFVRFSETHVEFSSPTLRLITRLIEGEFPNWKQLIPDGNRNVLHADIQALKETVEAAAVVLGKNGQPMVKLHLGSELTVTARGEGIGEITVPLQAAHYDGEEMVIGFNPGFFTDGLDFVAAGRIRLELSDSLKPAIFRPDGLATRDALYLLMPVRIKTPMFKERP